MVYKQITKQQSYYLGITMWGYLYNFPEIDYKYKLPRKLYSIVKQLYFHCPCCTVFFNKKKNIRYCPECPLDGNCIEGEALYKTWSETTDIKVRKVYAKKILDRIIEKGI
jgi:hypothetical protein